MLPSLDCLLSNRYKDHQSQIWFQDQKDCCHFKVIVVNKESFIFSIAGSEEFVLLGGLVNNILKRAEHASIDILFIGI